MYRRFSVSGFLVSLIEAFVGIIEIFLGLRLILKLFAANANTPFVAWIYETTRGMLAPFANMFPNPVLDGGIVIEFSTIFAMFAYAILGYLITELILYIAYYSTTYERVPGSTTTTKTVRTS